MKGDFDGVLSGVVSPEDAAAIALHLKDCEECRSLADDVLSLGTAAAAFDAAFRTEPDLHPEEDELAMFVDGAIDAPRRAGIERHLETCAGCRGEVDDLRAWIGTVKPRPRTRVWLYAAAAAAMIAIAILLIAPRFETTPRSTPIRRAIVTAPAPPAPPARPAEWDALVREVQRTGLLPLPKDIREFAADDTYRGGTNVADRIDVWPAATVVDDIHPEFRWTPVPHARYTVIVRTNDTKVASSPLLDEPHWMCDVALKRGRTYRWQVRAQTGDSTLILPPPPAPPAIFRVLTESARTELARASREAPDDHLLLAVLYAHHGVVDAARRELEAYARTAGDAKASPLLAQLP